MNFSIPDEVKEIISTLTKAGHKAYVVGGSVRDLLIGRVPKDWDVATDAKPEEIQILFSTFAGATADRPATVYENEFGTVLVKLKPRTDAEDNADQHGNYQRKSASSLRKSALDTVEVTTFRKEETYSDLRHPDRVSFTNSIEEDLARRDFTINAIAMSENGEIIDPFKGRDDLEATLVRAVGDVRRRFGEDALRLMRAVRFAAELGFNIEEETESAAKSHARLLAKIAKERIRDEFAKILMSPGGGPKWGVEELEALGLLEYILPELREGIGVGQNKHHIYSVWEHNILSLDYAAKENYELEIRMAALLHDMGKPRTKGGDGPDSTFYNHEVVGSKIAEEALERLRFSNEFIKKVTHLIRYHMFYYNVDEVTGAGVRRFIKRVGSENISDLVKLREADRIGSGVPKAVPYKLRHLMFMIERVKRDPISPKMLKVRGDELMHVLNLEPSPRVGWILGILLESVIDDPGKNDNTPLLKYAKELNRLSDSELEKKAKDAEGVKTEFESGVEKDMKKKYYVS